jgi:hypothetical protein
LGPKFPTLEPICVKCLQYLKRSESTVESLCEQCLWPICGFGCKISINPHIHNEECKILQTGADKIAKTNNYMYEILTPLKCLLLQFNDNKWSRLMEMESHMKHRGPDSQVYEYATFFQVNNLLIKTYLTIYVTLGRLIQFVIT